MSLTISDAGRPAFVPAYQPPPPPPPPVAENYRAGDGTFSDQTQGTAPDPANDQLFAMMANGAYAPDSPEYAQALEDAGWTALQPHEDGVSLTDQHGNRIPIDPGLLSDPASGFHAEIYQHEDGSYVVAYRGSEVGTQQSEIMDWVNNGQQGLGMDSAQYSSAIELAQRAEHVFGEGNVALTGHSLGGGLASAASLATGASAVTFNASGLSDETLESLGFNPNEVRSRVDDSGQIRRYAVNGDPLTAAQEDLPLLPIVGSPPEAIGHALRIDPPPGTGFGGLHGGGGEDVSYVDAFDHAAPYDPADGPTPSQWLGEQANHGIDALGDGARQGLDAVGEQLRNGPGATPQSWVVGSLLSGTGFVVDHGADFLGNVVETTTGFVGDTAVAGLENLGDLQFNNLASGIREITDLGGDLAGTGSELVEGLTQSGADLLDGDLVEGGFGALGDLADAGVDTLGDLADGAVSLFGDGVQNSANATGGMLRDFGDIIGLSTPADAVAGFVEGTGGFVSDVADNVGSFVDDAADTIGDGLETASDFVGDVGQGVSDAANAVGDFLNPFN